MKCFFKGCEGKKLVILKAKSDNRSEGHKDKGRYSRGTSKRFFIHLKILKSKHQTLMIPNLSFDEPQREANYEH